MMVYVPRIASDELAAVTDRFGSYRASTCRPGQSRWCPDESGESPTFSGYRLTDCDTAETFEGDGEESGRGELWQDRRDEP
jgi:hypothetical protein